MRYILLPIVFNILTIYSNAQTGVTAKGLHYKFLNNTPGETAKPGDQSKLHITVLVQDSIVFDSKAINNNQPVPQPISESQSAADLMEVFTLMSEGDIAIFKVHSKAIFPNKDLRPPFIKLNDSITYRVEMVELRTKEQLLAEKLEHYEKDRKDLKNYAKENNIEIIETPEGDFVSIVEHGMGSPVKRYEIISMNYTGYLLDGTVFDSNVDPRFEHTNEFEFVLGKRQVIIGWDKTLAGFPVGSKLKLLITSPNAYGASVIPPSEANPKGIPANSALIFDVEILGSRDAPEIDITEEEIEE